ncbi:hypothetical protein [Flavobacterium piscis]|uniref:hypothetical protein n=1 Tax=Flavobacterium piscis TaxID=1114874 RepID=UPI0013F4F4AD|nr:hypothetical protein [Flavobacterium piscis]
MNTKNAVSGATKSGTDKKRSTKSTDHKAVTSKDERKPSSGNNKKSDNEHKDSGSSGK